MPCSMNCRLIRVQPQIFSAQAARLSVMICQGTSVSSSGSSSRISFQQVPSELDPSLLSIFSIFSFSCILHRKTCLLQQASSLQTHAWPVKAAKR